jgi:hypothetical protein
MMITRITRPCMQHDCYTGKMRCAVYRQQISLTRLNTSLDDIARLGSSWVRPFEEVADVPPISGGSNNFKNARAASRPNPEGLHLPAASAREIDSHVLCGHGSHNEGSIKGPRLQKAGSDATPQGGLWTLLDLAITDSFRLANCADLTSSAVRLLAALRSGS